MLKNSEDISYKSKKKSLTFKKNIYCIYSLKNFLSDIFLDKSISYLCDCCCTKF